MLTEAICWIAFNDDADLGDEAGGWIISICLVADLWRRPQAEIARCVMAERAGRRWRIAPRVREIEPYS